MVSTQVPRTKEDVLRARERENQCNCFGISKHLKSMKSLYCHDFILPLSKCSHTRVLRLAMKEQNI